MENKPDKRIVRQIKLLTALYVVSGLGAFIAFTAAWAPETPRVLVGSIFSVTAAFALKRTQFIKMMHEDEYQLMQKNQPNVKKVLIYGFLGFLVFAAILVVIGVYFSNGI